MERTGVFIPTDEGEADAYLVRPDGDARYPGVLLLIDAFGLRPQIQRMADRIADRGYVVLAPNTLYRGGPAPVVATEGLDDPARRKEVFDRVVPLIDALTHDRIEADGRAYLDRLAETSEVPPAVVGYCMGGRLGWHLATALPDRIGALACFHTGGLVTETAGSPHLRARALACDAYFGFADADATMTNEQITQLERSLDAAGAAYTSEIYEGAPHGYTMADTPAYVEAAAERHHRELAALLGRTVGRQR